MFDVKIDGTTTDVEKVISIDVSDLEIEAGESKLLEVITSPIDNIESLIYESSDESIVKVDNFGNITALKEGVATVTVSGSISTDIKDICTITVLASPIGDYVEYDVAYTDMESGYNFTNLNGWRILDPGTKNEDGTYSNTKIVSTGLPAKLSYEWLQNPSSTENSSSLWWGTVSQINSEYGLELDEWKSSYSGFFAAYGLKYNFSSIPFSKSTTSEYSEGYYTEITNLEASNENTGDIFKTSKATEVHNLTKEEINKARNLDSSDSTSVKKADGDTGLFYLDNLGEENSDFAYSSSPEYWLATPTYNNYQALTYVYSSYGIGMYTPEAVFYVRPVITLNSNIEEISEGHWTIVD